MINQLILRTLANTSTAISKILKTISSHITFVNSLTTQYEQMQCHWSIWYVCKALIGQYVMWSDMIGSRAGYDVKSVSYSTVTKLKTRVVILCNKDLSWFLWLRKRVGSNNSNSNLFSGPTSTVTRCVVLQLRSVINANKSLPSGGCFK